MELPISLTLAWFLVGIAFYLTELALPGFIIFFFGIGAWCAALAVFLFDISLTNQLIVFLIGSLISLFSLRSYLKGVFLGKNTEQADSVISNNKTSTGTVIEDIMPPAEGKIKYAGTFWRAASSQQITAGTVVEIIEQEDLLVRVTPVQNNGEE